MEKIDVKGPNAHPLFSWLQAQKSSWMGSGAPPAACPFSSSSSSASADETKIALLTAGIKWNFSKFLIDKEGQVPLHTHPPTHTPRAPPPTPTHRHAHRHTHTHTTHSPSKLIDNRFGCRRAQCIDRFAPTTGISSVAKAVSKLL